MQRPKAWQQPWRRAWTLLFMITMTSALALAQSADTLWNQTDAMGRKQGYWKKHYPDGSLLYMGFFRDDRPAGRMTRYYANGKKKAELHYPAGSAAVYAKLFFETGKLGARGKYLGRIKDSTWTYYSDSDERIVLTEQYVQGRREGTSTKYYPGGQIAERMEWKNDIHHGNWEQYYENGELRLRASYVNGKLEGPYRVFTKDGHHSLKGQYQADRMDGDWEFYNDEGTLERTLHYDQGVLLNEEVLEEWVSNFMKTIDENEGSIPEVDLENFFDRSP